MKNDSKMMNGDESLKLITEMIQKTRSNIKQGSFHLLFWGWLILFCSLAEFLLTYFSDFKYPYLVWMLTLPGLIVSLIYGYRTGRKQLVHTYADKLNMWTWYAFIAAMIIVFTLLSDRLNDVLPFILLLAGYATFMSGIIIRFKPLIFGGISFWVFAVIAYFTEPMVAQILFSVAIITGYLIPGYLLRKSK